MIKNTCPNAGTPSIRLARAAEIGAELAVTAVGVLRPAAIASTGRSTTAILVRTETRLPRHDSRPGRSAPGQHRAVGRPDRSARPAPSGDVTGCANTL